MEVNPNTEQTICVSENFGNEVIIFNIHDGSSKEDSFYFATAFDPTNETDYIPFSFWTMHTIPDKGLTFTTAFKVSHPTYTIDEYIQQENVYSSPCNPSESLNTAILKKQIPVNQEVFLTTCTIRTTFTSELEHVQYDVPSKLAKNKNFTSSIVLLGHNEVP